MIAEAGQPWFPHEGNFNGKFCQGGPSQSREAGFSMWIRVLRSRHAGLSTAPDRSQLGENLEVLRPLRAPVL